MRLHSVNLRHANRSGFDLGIISEHAGLGKWTGMQRAGQVLPPDCIREPLDGGVTARGLVLSVYGAVLGAVRAGPLTRSVLSVTADGVSVGDMHYAVPGGGRLVVLGAGKAACGMAAAALDILGARVSSAIVVTKGGYAVEVDGAQVLEAAHPVPDHGSVVAGNRFLGELECLGPDDLVLFLLSGGASALLERPAGSLTLDDLRYTTTALLRSGAPIGEVNRVRSCLSGIKAGGIARAAAPARVACLVLSDVLGNPLETIGSGPCVDCSPDPAGAINILQSRGVWEGLPRAVQEHLLAGGLPCGGAVPRVQHIIVGDIATAVDAAVAEAHRLGLRPEVLTTNLVGEARDAGDLLGEAAVELSVGTGAPDCLIAAGETTVTVTGSGVGGRCQELAAAAALKIRGHPGVALLAAGTDGSDGPTDAAGALVDGDTATQPGDLIKALQDNDTYPALDRLGAILRTGSTDSNVGDVVIVVRSPQGR